MTIPRIVIAINPFDFVVAKTTVVVAIRTLVALDEPSALVIGQTPCVAHPRKDYRFFFACSRTSGA